MIAKEPIILFRRGFEEENEFDICRQYFHTVCELRSDCNKRTTNNGIVIGRYSCLPYYHELEQDLSQHGLRLINSYGQHKWIADFDYYNVVQDHTPKTWFDHDFHACEHDGPFVVKGATNSRKHQWDTAMFAKNRADALRISSILLADSLISQQQIIYRQYVPLETYEIGLNGIRFTNEWRFFYLGSTLLSCGYYWSIAENTNRHIDHEGIHFANTIAQAVAHYVNFFVLDIAKTESGNWILIEINDGQMSGLSCNDPHALYQNMAEQGRNYEG